MQTYLSELYNFIHPSPTKEYHEQTIASFLFNAPSIVLSRVLRQNASPQLHSQ